MDEGRIIDRLVDPYNRRHADAFTDLFAARAVACEHPGEVAQRGREEIRAFYRAAFSRSPNGRTKVLHRVHLGSRVVENEFVDRGVGAPFECVAIYVVKNGEIARLDLAGDPSSV